MKAVIMAGGKGVRLRPLTLETPKPLQPLLNKPVVYYILELLKRHRIDNVVLTLGYHGQRLQNALRGYGALSLAFSEEDTPLGTAGGVKHALGEYDGETVVISGDAMCDFDLTAAIAFHRGKQSDVTIVTKRVDDPREYGLVCADKEGSITAFLEKPSYASCVCDLANTGVYILSAAALSMIEQGKPADFAQDIFPLMLERGMRLFSYEEKGYWCDVGDVKSYLQCQYDMLAGKVRCEIEGVRAGGCFLKGKLPMGQYNVIPDVYIGEGVTIGNETKIDRNTVIGDHVTIGTNCDLRGAILQSGCHIGDNVTLNQAVCGSGSAIENDVTVNEGCVIGSGSVVGRGATLNSGVSVWDNKTVEQGVILADDLQVGFAREILFDDDGIVGQTNVVITPALCTKIGSGVASLQCGATIGFSHSHHTASKALALAVMSGVLAAGENLWNFGECTLSQFEFCMHKSQVDFGIYLDGGVVTVIKVVQRSALPMKRPMERKLENAINRGDYQKAASGKMGTVTSVESMSKLYSIELLKQCDAPLDGLTVSVSAASKAVRQQLEETLTALGCQIEEGGMAVAISPDGKQVTICGKDGTVLYYERILAILCLAEFKKGEDVALPHAAPKIIDRLAQEYGRKVYRYSDCPCDERDAQARSKAAAKPYLRDGLMMAVKLLSFMVLNHKDLAELCTLVPNFNVSARLVSISVNPGQLLQKLSGANSEISEGLALEQDGMSAYIKPVKTGKGIMIYTEGEMNETAVEIGDIFEQLIKAASLDS